MVTGADMTNFLSRWNEKEKAQLALHHKTFYVKATG